MYFSRKAHIRFACLSLSPLSLQFGAKVALAFVNSDNLQSVKEEWIGDAHASAREGQHHSFPPHIQPHMKILVVENMGNLGDDEEAVHKLLNPWRRISCNTNQAILDPSFLICVPGLGFVERMPPCFIIHFFHLNKGHFAPLFMER